MIALALALLAAATPCGPSRAHTLASTHSARVYTQAGAVYGCVRGRRPVRLAPPAHLGSPQLEQFAISGRHAAFAEGSHGVDTSSASVVVVDLRSGRRLAVLPAATPPRRPESFESVTALVLSGTRVAWIASSGAVGLPVPRYEVHAGRKLLDEAPDIAPRSLALRGSTVSWRHGGAARHAPLTR